MNDMQHRLFTDAGHGEGGALEALGRRDADIARILQTYGPPPDRSLPASFDTLARAIVGQQVSRAAASSIWARMEDAGFTDAAFCATSTPERLMPAGLSRRKADAAIADGRVTVDGVVADGRTPVERGSEVRLDGEPQVWEAREAAKADLTSSDAFLYLKYWKPAGVTCTSDRDDASNVIARGGFDDLDQRVFTVGRLDKPSTGLLLLTSDGRACEALLRPSQKKEKRYVVEVDRAPTADDLRALREGVTIETVAQRDRKAKPLVAKTKPCEVRAPNAKAPRLLEFTLTEGRNRQIRKMCAARGLEVVSLHRTHFAGVTLDGLVAGGWAPLSAKERRRVDAALADRD